jgi:hypothetical protein
MIHLDADSVIEGIVQWCSRLRDIKDDAAFEIAWTETWAWITDPLRAATLNALLDGNEHPSMCELLPPFQRRWLAIKERKEAEHLISSPWGANAVARDRVRAGFGRLTYDRVRELFDLVELGSCRKFVMVGCGAFPAAILLVRDLTSVPDLIALDVEFEAATMAQRVVDAIGDHRIHVHRIDGADYSYVGADVIYIANHVCSKARSIERVRDSAPQDAGVIRSTLGTYDSRASRRLSCSPHRNRKAISASCDDAGENVHYYRDCVSLRYGGSNASQI